MKTQGVLFIVATPIGNLGDISHRALDILRNVETVLAEDTRHSKRLFNHYGISNKLRSCHEHNEDQILNWLYQKLDSGCDIALISDAGTPLISDPGFIIVRALRDRGYKVNAVPGASSVIAALSIAGLPTDRFVFDGFLSAKGPARRTQLAKYDTEPRTIVLLESSHRIVACLYDIATVLGDDRQLVIARELTKKFETVLSGSASQLHELLENDTNQTRGEFVLMLHGVQELESDQADVSAVLKVLMSELPLKQAAGLAAKLTDTRKNDVYDLALSLKAEN